MVTGNESSYVFMSEGLEPDLELETLPFDRPRATLKVSNQALKFEVISLESCDDGSVTCCVDLVVGFERLAGLLITGEIMSLNLIGKEFKCRIWKLESDRCYLKILR